MKYNEKEVDDESTKNFKLIILVTIIIIILLWAWLTKAGFIPNFTDSELLCHWEKEVILDDYKNNRYWSKKVYNDIWPDVKPLIYLYPQQKQKIKVELNYKWKIIADYPKYDKKIKGWEVEVYPDSKIIDLRDWNEYSYLFWEWIPDLKRNWNLEEWFVVKWEKSREFLREKLEYLWLTPKEYNEFIVFWYPKMMNNKYNLIHFATEEYTKTAPLKITPEPDSMLRVFMIMKSLEEKIEIKTQKLKSFKRKGFTVIEWGWNELK